MQAQQIVNSDQVAQHNLATWNQISLVSSGSLASITGITRYDQMEVFRGWMFLYLSGHPAPFGEPRQWIENVKELFALYQEQANEDPK